MKKLLLIALLALGISAMTLAQSDSVHNATIDSLSAKIDNLALSQSALESQYGSISRGNFDNIVDELVPIGVLALLAGCAIAMTFIISTTNYRKAQLKYNAMLKCVETTGSVPDFFSKVESQKAKAIPTGGRVHLVLSLLSCTIGSVFVIVTIASDMSLVSKTLCGSVGLAFMVACVILFKQYNRIVSENSRIEQ